MTDYILRDGYAGVKRMCNSDWKGDHAGSAIREFAANSLRFLLGRCELVELVSRVPGKQYFSFRNDNAVARPANERQFIADIVEYMQLQQYWFDGSISAQDRERLIYTTALAPCLAMEVFDRQNKKGPATYFECYVGHLFASSFGVNPTRRARLRVHDRDVLMTMDFLFDTGDQYRNIHLPVKMSTRERVVQAWSHQRLLDSGYGDHGYRGVMVAFSETKLDSRNLEVVEICVPDQWLAYQTLLAQMDRIYYFDVPERYRVLTTEYPGVITIKPFDEFFTETERQAVLRL